MSLTALHAVELQLILRCCDAPSLLSLARCSRTLLAAARHPFATACLSEVRLKVGGATVIATIAASRGVLQHAPLRVEWNLKDARWSESDMREDMAAVLSLSRLRSLAVVGGWWNEQAGRWEGLADLEAGWLADAMTSSGHPEQLTSLVLNSHHFKLPGNGAAKLASALKVFTQLELLDLSRNSLKAEEANMMLSSVTGSVRVFRLECASVQSAPFAQLAATLASCPHLEEVSFAECDLRWGCMSALAPLLPSFPSLHTLNVSRCQLKDKEAYELAAVLPRCLTLHTLLCDLNPMMRSGFESILDAKSDSLRVISLQCASVEERDQQRMREWMAKKRPHVALTLYKRPY